MPSNENEHCIAIEIPWDTINLLFQATRGSTVHIFRFLQANMQPTSQAQQLSIRRKLLQIKMLCDIFDQD